MANPKKSAAHKRVSLPIVGSETTVDLPVPGGRAGLTAILPAMRKLSTAMMSVAETESAKEGRHITCRAGCAHCCRQLIPVSLPEAESLAAAVARLPAAKQKNIRKRFDFVISELERANLLMPNLGAPRTGLVSEETSGPSGMWRDVTRRYYSLKLDCPFLENARCSIYEERPFVCREYVVTSDPELCRELDAQVEAIARPTCVTPAVAAVAAELDGVHPATIPLPLALEWIEARGDELSNDHDVAAALDLALEALEWNEESVS
jgi:Fe-S-cluster containining protein